MANKNNGFTLVELSIVLIIIGLIISGVLTGKNLIEAAKLRAQVTQLQEYKAAYNTFKLKYDAVPGDMDNASDYWPGVYDGNGDGRLNSQANSAPTLGESVSLFQHLASAKFIPGAYSQVWEIDVGYPRLKIDENKGMVAAGNIITFGGGILLLSEAVHNKERIAALHLHASNPDIMNNTYDDNIGTLNILQAYNLDIKIDDGIALSGLFHGYGAHNPNDGQCLNAVDGDYNMSFPDRMSCNGMYILEK